MRQNLTKSTYGCQNFARLHSHAGKFIPELSNSHPHAAHCGDGLEYAFVHLIVQRKKMTLDSDVAGAGLQFEADEALGRPSRPPLHVAPKYRRPQTTPLLESDEWICRACLCSGALTRFGVLAMYVLP